ncbi:SPOSA6832_04817 [Sporobolomyces salmonicolor]|uniref:SPOSA6832_04817-mRNA-1:cds n=1 Tax=Sporidiobolus salmonicolor TaxID=5005 RepID=A0A0D6ET30_SPOSA|nr:SPOSA6832_04817 [Sporobolomyces salmonicolor]
MSNIWLAAGEGNLERVRELVESGVHPNVADENSYTPLHAAASWGHPDILRYLVDKGGNINVTDSDGETPLYVVEQVGMARLVIELGGDPNWRNEEGLSPAASLHEEYPHISLYLRTVTGEAAPLSASDPSSSSGDPSAAAAQPDLDADTDELIAAVRTIMEASQRGELTEAETDEKLREVVEQAVAGQVETGRAIGASMPEGETGGAVRDRNGSEEDDQGNGSKRPRENIGR